MIVLEEVTVGSMSFCSMDKAANGLAMRKGGPSVFVGPAKFSALALGYDGQ